MNIKTILCPTDLSTEADEALRYALALAFAYNAKLTLLYCREPGSIVEWSTGSRAARVFEQSLFTRLDAREFRSLDWEPAIVEAQDAGSGIVAEAKERNVDLIVMRSRRRPVAATLLGSTAETVCKSAPCPVLVTHPTEREWVGYSTTEVDLHRVLIAYDNSRDADLALNYGMSLAEQSQAQVHLLHVMSYKAALEVESDDDTATSEEIAAQRLRVLIPEEAKLWCDLITSARCGNPPDEILAYAKEKEIDLICMGASGKGFSLEKLFGSTVDRVLRSAPCPVLIARPVAAASSSAKAA
jgi:nucleotide-binding universal stress UspA family protein